MNIHFSRIIKAGDKQREFNFTRFQSETDYRYHVDVTDDSGKRLTFSMYRNADGAWKTTAQSLPIWIHNAEDILGNVIEEELKSAATSR